MDKNKYYSKVNLLKKFIESSSLLGNKNNYFIYRKTNSNEHELRKFYVFMELVKKDFEVLTEVKFKYNLGIADIVCFDRQGNGHIFEIISSEKQDSIDSKMNKYPIDFEIHLIKCKEPIEIVI